MKADTKHIHTASPTVLTRYISQIYQIFYVEDVIFCKLHNLIKYGNYVEMRINNGVKIQSVKMNASWISDMYITFEFQI